MLYTLYLKIWILPLLRKPMVRVLLLWNVCVIVNGVKFEIVKHLKLDWFNKCQWFGYENQIQCKENEEGTLVLK